LLNLFLEPSNPEKNHLSSETPPVNFRDRLLKF
jgi:hypothetical protein